MTNPPTEASSAPHHGKLPAPLRRRRAGWIVPLAILTVLAAGACSSSYERKTDSISKEEVLREITFDRLLATKILERYASSDDTELNRYVNQVGRAVALFSGRSDIAYHCTVLDSPSVNAFATPGGYVFITTGAILAMQDEAELAGVLAHEIGHINLRHIMKEFPPPRETPSFTSIMVSILLSQGTAATTAFGEVLGKAGDLLFSRGYKIEDEYEADASAITYLAATGYPARALADFLDRLPDKDKGYGTHPAQSLRIQKLRTRADAEGFPSDRPRAKERFTAMRSRVETALARRDLEKFGQVKFGRLITESILATRPLVENQDLLRYTGSVAKALGLFSGRSDFEYVCAVHKGKGDWAAPGGYILISQDTLLLAKSEAELAAAISLQIAHINLGHLLASHPLPERMADLATWRKRASEAASRLVSSGYTSREVLAADRAALIMLVETGYDGEALAGMIERLPAERGPDRISRAGRLREMMRTEFGMKRGKSAVERFLAQRTRGLAAATK